MRHRVSGALALSLLMAALRFGVYILRPPAHGERLLANAQCRWLRTAGDREGWRRVGYLDDLVILPLGIALTIRLIPRDVWDECRLRAEREPPVMGRAGWIVAAVIILLWVLLVVWIVLHVF